MKVLKSTIIILFLSVSFFSCKNTINNPETLIKKYLKSESISERLKYVADSAIVKPLMQSYYLNGMSEIVSIDNILKIDNPDLPNNYQYFRVAFSYKLPNGQSRKNVGYYYVVDNENDGLKLDWVVSTGNNKESFRLFQNERSKDIGIFRFGCQLSNYYNYGFASSEDKYYSVECISPTDDLIVYGYIRKTSEDGQRIYKLLQDGERHNLVLAVNYDFRSGGSEEIVLIKKVVSDGWYYDESASVTIPEILQDYLWNSNLYSSLSFKVLEYNRPTDVQFERKFKFEFSNYDFVINNELWLQGRRLSEQKDYHFLDEDILEVKSSTTKSILTGMSYDNSRKVIVKMPRENEKVSWNNIDKEGYESTWISEFVELEFNGEKTKAIKVSERSAVNDNTVIERLYLKGYGFCNEIMKSDDGEFIYQLVFSE